MAGSKEGGGAGVTELLERMAGLIRDGGRIKGGLTVGWIGA